MRSFPHLLTILTLSAAALAGCQSAETQQTETHSRYATGVLPEQTPALQAEEFALYLKQHPELDEASARQSFEEIQVLSGLYQDEKAAVWADRRALAQAWLKHEIEDVYHPDTVNDEMIQSAIDAYAFKSGHPALVTVSHILIHPDSVTTPEMRREALDKIRTELLNSRAFTNEALSEAAQRLTLAGYRVDMNPDLQFPRHAMTRFLGEGLNYPTVVEPFAEASFKLSENDPLSPVIESEFGYHIILFRSRTEEKKAQLPQDREFMVSRIVQYGRTLYFAQQIEEAMSKVPIKVNEALIGELTASKPAE